MIYSIFWTENAKESYASILDLMIYRFGVNATLKMDDKVEKLLTLLESNKHLCPPTETNVLVRRCIITKQLSVVYRINENSIELLAFYDNRANFEF
jgi:plasmid stabilization system protein ParE